MKLKSKTITIPIVVTLISVFIAVPSYGITLQQFLSLVTQITNTWADISQDAEQAVDDSTGDMEEPDTTAASDDLKDQIADEYSLPVAQEKAQDLERALARASVKGVLGTDGQTDRANKIAATTQTAQNAETLAQEAQNMDASQNILKVIAAQNAQVVLMLAEQRNDSLESRSDTTQSNLMLTQIAEHLANTRKTEDVEKTGVTSLNLQLVGMSRLDPTQLVIETEEEEETSAPTD